MATRMPPPAVPAETPCSSVMAVKSRFGLVGSTAIAPSIWFLDEREMLTLVTGDRNSLASLKTRTATGYTPGLSYRCEPLTKNWEVAGFGREIKPELSARLPSPQSISKLK